MTRTKFYKTEKNMKKNITSWLCKTAALLACATSAYAVNSDPATLFLWDGTAAHDTTVKDGSAGDLASGTVGQVLFSGSVGNWTINVDTGLSKPVDGTAISPVMDLSFSHVLSGSAGTLGVAFFDDNFGPSGLAGALAHIGGTLPSGVTLTYSTYVNVGNITPTFVGGALSVPTVGVGAWTLLTSQTFNGAGVAPGNSFGGDTGAASISGGSTSYSLLQVITITSSGATSFSGNANLHTVPDGGMTLMLLGSSLTALGLVRRSFKSGKA